MATTLQSCISLALDVTPKLRDLTRALVKTLKEPVARNFLTNLSVELLFIQVWLEDLQSPPGESKDDLVKLLRDLERVCIYPATLRASHAPSQFCPTLKALRSTSAVSVKATITAALRRLASDTNDVTIRRRKQLLAVLKKFAQHGVPDQPNVLFEVGDFKDDERVKCEDASAFVTALYDAFASHRVCFNSTSNEPTHIRANIGLSGLENVRDHLLDFEVPFLAHPHVDAVWQDTRISVIRPRTVGFLDDVNDSLANLTASNLVPIQENGICEIVDGEDQVKLVLRVQDDQLMYESVASRDIYEWPMNHRSIDLATILARESLTHKMRLLLSTVLAKAVWQFYKSDWMIQEWNKEHIHFMYTCTSKDNGASGRLYASKPYLSTHLVDLEESTPVRGRSHQFPKIFSLGIMLLEIELDVTIESQRRPEHLRTDGLPNTLTDYTTAQWICDDDQVWADRDTYDVHRAVIAGCINGDQFEACANAQEEREVLFEKVVSPLQKLLKVAWPSLDERSLGPMKLESVASSYLRPHNTLPTARTISPVTMETHSDHDTRQSVDSNGQIKHQNLHYAMHNNGVLPMPWAMTPTVNKLAAAADDWFTRIDTMNRLLRKRRKLGGYEKVKIAIIDTGIHGDHPHWSRIRGWKDFVTEGNQKGIDATGHGTNGVDLIWKVLPEADIFVARIFEKEKADARTPALMAKAIRHATEKWDVDIITISAGFDEDSLGEEEHQHIRHAILAANLSNILIFAAASNYGNIARITFPASMHGNVICIFSSTGLVKQSESFNPAPSESSGLNFCILGEDVQKVQYTADKTTARTSGTSVATSIAAGIAALVIDFTRQTDCQSKIPNVKKLKSIPGMSAIFREMARGGKDNGYDCVAPWKLLECSAGFMQVWDDARKREHISGQISEALLST